MMDNIYITGFMGAGKSTIGRTLSRILKRRFVDMDEEISRNSGMSVREYFEEFGEHNFREAETKLLQKIASGKSLVVSTGGGVPTSPINRKIMRDSGKIVHLNAPLDECLGRLGVETDSVRPLWSDLTSVSALYNNRREAYADCDLLVEASKKLAEELAWEICEKLQPQRSIDVQLGGVSHPLVFTWRAHEEVSILAKPSKTFVITDKHVSRLHMERYSNVLGDATVVALKAGERSKTLGSARRLYEAMLKDRLGRDGLVVAIGGGVITDLGAFVASTYKRGVPFILVSTSLVGCVDAAIGGKAAVDLKEVKNPVGCFAAPSAVLLDLRALSALPGKYIAEGLIEAYKTGLVADPSLAELIESNVDTLLRGDLFIMAEVVRLSASAKADIVGQDFKESGRRRILNFGHTYGHAVESFNNYRLSHGVSVALGMMVAVAISENRGLLGNKLSVGIQTTLGNFVQSLAVMPSATEAWRIMMNDKKNHNGRITFVLLTGLGSPICVDDLRPEELDAAIRSVEGLKNG
ncbi:MAG: bifunctional shikimate kinase/3-dehydroquinate synthase [Desulfomonilaceae bacterium]